MSEHPEFECVIAQMRALEAMFLSDADKPVIGKDLLPICEAIRMLAIKMVDVTPAPVEDELSTVVEMSR